MARRYDHTPEELKELAIKAGLDLINESGFAKFSARGAAARIGYTVGTLYHIFGSLEIYILHINARTLDEWYDELSKSLAECKGDKLKCLARGYIGFAKSHYNRFTALFEHKLAEATPVPEWYKPRMNRLFGLVEAALKPQVQDEKRARHLAKVLWASIHGITILSLSGKLELVAADSAERLTDTVLKGLLVH